MIKSRLTISTLSLSVALLTVASFQVNAKEKISIDLKPRSEWQTTMIEGRSDADSYCALVRKYDQGLVFTLGKNTRDEYSLAFDFQNEKLNTEKAYKINLQPGPGQLRAYEMMPASQQALVVSLGYDEGFLQAIKKSNQLKAEIDGKNYQFAMNDLDKGTIKLETCVAGLTGANVTKTAENFSAEKVSDAKLLQESTSSTANKVEAKKSVEDKKSVNIPSPERVTTKKIEETKEEAKAEMPADVKVEKSQAPKREIKISRVDSQSLPMAKAEMPAVSAPKVEETRVAVKAPEPVVKTMPKKEKIAESDIPKMEDKKLAENTRVSVAPSMGVSVRPNSIAAQDKVYGSKAVPHKSPDVKPDVKKAQAKLEPETQAQAESFEIVMPAKEAREKAAAKVKAEKVKEESKAKEIKIERTKAEKVDLIPRAPEGQANALAQQQAMVETRSIETDRELEKVRKQLKELERENHQLYKDAREARGQIDMAVVKTSNEALKKIRAYEKKLEAAQADNLALSREIEEMRRIQEDVDVRALAGDTGAQQALKRYNEAQREIKRLGLLLEQQRLAHRQEKNELEEMLFDPAVTDKAQQKRLMDLESKLAEAEKRLQIESQKVGKIDPAIQKKLKDMEFRLAESKKREEQLKREQQALKEKQKAVETQAQKLATLESKLATLAQKEQALKVKEERLLSEEKKISNAESKMAELKVKQEELKAAEQKMRIEAQKVAAAEAKLAQAAQKEQELKVAEERMRMEAQKVATAEAKLAQAAQKEQELKAAEERMRMEAQKVAAAEAKLAQAAQKEQELRAAEQRMRIEAQRMAAAEAKLAQAAQKQQELFRAERALEAKTSKVMASAEARVASANAKLVEMSKKEQEMKEAEKRLVAQSQKVAAYSKARSVQKDTAQMVSQPVPLNPSAKNIRSNPSVTKAPARAPRPSFGQGNIQQLLNQSGLSSVSSVTQKSAGLYSWNAAGMTGKAQVSNAGQNLSQFAQNFIAKEKQGCKGDFASLPATVPNGKTGFEIACVGPSGGKSSSVVFAQKNGNLIAITHETTADNMDAAIDARDKIAARL